MQIPVEDLNLHPILTGKNLLEWFFGKATDTGTTKDFINWVTNAIKAKELELYYHSSSAKSSESSIRINYGMGSQYWFERCEFEQEEIFRWMKDKKIISRLSDRGIKVEKDLVEAIDKLLRENQTIEKISPKTTSTKGRPRPTLKPFVIEEALKIRKEKGPISAPKVAKMTKITKILAPGAPHTSLKDITDNDYKSRYGKKPRTVADWIREGFRDNPTT